MLTESCSVLTLVGSRKVYSEQCVCLLPPSLCLLVSPAALHVQGETSNTDKTIALTQLQLTVCLQQLVCLQGSHSYHSTTGAYMAELCRFRNTKENMKQICEHQTHCKYRNDAHPQNTEKAPLGGALGGTSTD